jgi:hypothetical protein
LQNLLLLRKKEATYHLAGVDSMTESRTFFPLQAGGAEGVFRQARVLVFPAILAFPCWTEILVDAIHFKAYDVNDYIWFVWGFLDR